MSDLGRDSFEEFMRNSLEDYSSSDSPNWEEMENRLDEVQGASSGGSGILGNPMSKWIAAALVAGGLTILIANLFNTEDEAMNNSSDGAVESFIDKIRALSIDDNSDLEESDEVDANGEIIGSSGAANKSSENPTNPETSEAELSDVVFKKQVPPAYTKPSGHNYSMLRAAEMNTPSPDPIAEFGANINEGCVPLKVDFKLESSDVGMKYFWNFGDGDYSIEENPQHVYRETGTYEVELTVTSVINQKFVTMLSSEPVIVHGVPEVGFLWENDENEAGNEVTFVDLSSNVVKWHWDFGDRTELSENESPSHTYSQEGTYTVRLVGTDANGCKDTLLSTIRISGKQLSHNFFAPTAFTPNGDGSNDEFRILINGPQTLEFEMTIYNRQGILVFETDDINQAWNGRIIRSGGLAPQGTYIWMVTLKDEKGNHDQQRGIFTLIK